MKTTDIKDISKLDVQVKIEELNKLAVETYEKGEDDNLSYLITAIAKIDSMLLDCDQFSEIDPNGDAVLVERTIRIRRFVNKADLDMSGIDYVHAAGLYIVAPVYLLPASKIRKAQNKKRGGCIFDPVAYGLPSNDEVDYATLKPLSATSYTAIAKIDDGGLMGSLVSTASHYENVELV